jgi:hypothetical protein
MEAIDIKKNYWKWKILSWIFQIPVFYIVLNYFLAPCAIGNNLSSPMCENIYPYVNIFVVPIFAQYFITILIVTIIMTLFPGVYCYLKSNRYKDKMISD